MNDLLITGGTILTLDPENPVLQESAILVRGGVIVKIGSIEEFPNHEAETLSCEGQVIMPGFINAHHHFYSTMTCGLTKVKPSHDFNQVLKNLWWRLDKKLIHEDIYYSSLVSLINCIRKGTTTIIDHHASPRVATGSLGIIGKAVSLAGLRACLCYEVSNRDGVSATVAGIEENLDWLENTREKHNDHLRGLFGLHAAFTVNDETMQSIADKTADLDCGYHLHVAEAKSDEEYSRQHFGKSVVARLHDFNLLNDKSIAAHCVHIDESEMELLASSGTAVVHNPQSNLNNAVGIADLCKLFKKGVLVGLGTDAMTANMMEESRVGLWAQHLRQNDPAKGFNEITSALLQNNALIANRYWDNRLGVIKEGKAADIIVLDYNPATPLTSENWQGHFVFGLSQSTVDTTMVNGRVLMWNKQLFLDIVEEEIALKSREYAAKLWKRM